MIRVWRGLKEYVDEGKLLLILPACSAKPSCTPPAGSNKVFVTFPDCCHGKSPYMLLVYSHRFYHSVIQELNQSINLSINSSINPSINLSIYPSIHLLICNQFTSPSSDQKGLLDRLKAILRIIQVRIFKSSTPIASCDEWHVLFQLYAESQVLQCR